MYDLKKATLTCIGSHIYVCTFCTNDDYDMQSKPYFHITMVTRCITIIIITCYGTSPQVTIVTSSSHVWSTNTWALAPKSPIYCPRSILSFSDNSFKYPHTIKLTNAFRCFILFFLRQMDGSRFSDPIKIKPRATESLSLPVGNCGEGSIRSKTSSGYYILVIVF